MYSEEFMRFLINYQKPSEPKRIKEIKNFNMPTGGNRLASILLTVKK